MSCIFPLKRIIAAPRLLLLCAILAFALAQVWLPVYAAVTLVSFDAEGREGHVLITWSTAQESDISGFYVLRSTELAGDYSRISSLIVATGQLGPADYEYDDQEVINGTTYYYRLEIVNPNNNSEFTDPISAVPGVATPTPTITNTPDPSVSPTITNTPGPTATASQTPTITNTPTQVPPSPQPPTDTPIPEATSTATATATITASPTLIPFPTVTLIYPSSPVTAAVTSSPLPEIADSSDPNGSPDGQNGILRIALIASIVLLWVLLGGWLYIFLYRGKL